MGEQSGSGAPSNLERHLARSSAPSPARAKLGRPILETTFRFRGIGSPRQGEDIETAWRRAVNCCLGWAKAIVAAEIPPQAWEGGSFSLEEPGQLLRCVSLTEPRIWSAQIQHPDTPFRDRPAVPGRFWTSEVALALFGGKIHVGIRVVCASQPYALEPVARTRPRLVLELLAALDFEGQRWTTGTPWRPGVDDTLALKELLEDPNRQGPVFLLTEPDENRLEGLKVRPFLLDAERLALKVQGLATVVCLDAATSWRWTELVGRRWSAYLGAVRTYLPGLRFDEDSPYSHPLILAERVIAFDYDGKIAEAAFEAFLIDQAYRIGAESKVDWSPCQFYANARLLETETRRLQASEDADWRALYEEEIASLREQYKKLEDNAEQYNNDALDERVWRREIESENSKLRKRIEILSRALECRSDPVVSDPQIPPGLGDLADWTDDNLTGRLVILPRALRSIQFANKQSAGQYEHTERLYRALILLAGPYRDSRLGLDGAKQRFEETLLSLELECRPPISDSSIGRFKDQYTVRYPAHSQRKREYELHLCHGNSREPRYAFRIYFFWDEDTSQVVVGHLPGHLDNSLT